MEIKMRLSKNSRIPIPTNKMFLEIAPPRPEWPSLTKVYVNLLKARCRVSRDHATISQDNGYVIVPSAHHVRTVQTRYLDNFKELSNKFSSMSINNFRAKESFREAKENDRITVVKSIAMDSLVSIGACWRTLAEFSRSRTNKSARYFNETARRLASQSFSRLVRGVFSNSISHYWLGGKFAGA